MSKSVPEGTGLTTTRNWREIEYNGILMLFYYDYDGNEVYLIAQTEVDGVGIVNSKMTCEPVGMTPAEAGKRWLSELDGEDFQQFYLAVKQAWTAFFYGGD